MYSENIKTLIWKEIGPYVNSSIVLNIQNRKLKLKTHEQMIG